MKRFLSVLLIAILLVMLTGCTQTKYDENDIGYDIVRDNSIVYESAETLTNSADCVYEGTVIDISFIAGNTANLFCISTVYTVLVTDEYKGDAHMIERIISPGGIYNYKVAEQMQAWRDAGKEYPATIRIYQDTPVLEKGETYVFFAGERLNDEPYNGCRPAVARMQFAINDDTDLTWVAGKITREDVYEYFGVDPVLRTVLRIGLCVVIIAGAAVATVLLIRRKKRKATPEETEQIPEET